MGTKSAEMQAFASVICVSLEYYYLRDNLRNIKLKIIIELIFPTPASNFYFITVII